MKLILLYSVFCVQSIVQSIPLPKISVTNAAMALPMVNDALVGFVSNYANKGAITSQNALETEKLKTAAIEQQIGQLNNAKEASHQQLVANSLGQLEQARADVAAKRQMLADQEKTNQPSDDFLKLQQQAAEYERKIAELSAAKNEKKSVDKGTGNSKRENGEDEPEEGDPAPVQIPKQQVTIPMQVQPVYEQMPYPQMNGYYPGMWAPATQPISQPVY